MDDETRNALARNVSILMRAREWKQTDLATHAGIAQTSVSNIVRADSGKSPTLSSIQAVAAALRVRPWMLLIPNVPEPMLRSPELPRLIDAFLRLERQGAAQVARVAEAEARYQIGKPGDE